MEHFLFFVKGVHSKEGGGGEASFYHIQADQSDYFAACLASFLLLIL